MIALVGEKNLNLFHVKGLCCSEAIIECLNRGFCGDLPDGLSARLGAGLCGGMGGGESVCGALSGAVVVLGVLLGPGREGGLSKKKMRLATKQLHDEFKKRFADTICNDLIKDYRGNKKARMKNCGEITAEAGRITVAVILEWRPALLQIADLVYLRKRDTRMSVLAQKIRLMAS